MRSEVRRPGVVARAAVLFLCIACAAGTLRADDADPPNSHPYVPAEWQYRWTALNMPPLEVIGSAGDAWLAGELPIQPPANASANVLYLRTRLPSALPRDPHLFVGELPRCWEVYVAGRLVASSVQFGPSERPEGNDIRLHGMIALPQAGEGQWLVLRLWRGDSLGISPTRVAIGSAGSLVLWQIRTFLPFMILGVIMGAVGIGCLVGYTFRPHPRPLLLLGLLSVSFSFISLVQSGLLTLLDCPPYVIALGWELTVLTSCVWVSLLLADLLPGIVARRLLRLAAVLQWAFVMGGLAAHGAQMISFHRLLDIWQNWTVAGTLPVIGIIVVGQLYQRNRDALIIIFVGVVPFGLIALARTLGAPIELVRALPWAAASLTAALAAVTVRKGARVWRQRLADEAVRQSERRMRSMLNATHDLAVLLNREHEILSINEIGAARLHVTIEEALGKCILEFLPAEIAKSRRAEYEQVWANGEPRQFEDEYSDHIYDHRAYPVVDENHIVVQIAVFSHDITQRRKAERALARARQRELETGSKIQSTLLVGRSPADLQGADVAALTIPSRQIDGDFYEFLQHTSSCFDVLVGDVMGKGVPAALVGAATKNQFLRVLGTDLRYQSPGRLPEPQEIVAAVHQKITQDMIVVESFATVCYARIDAETHELSFVDCGHTGTIHYRTDAGKAEVLRGTNMPLGFRVQEQYEQQTVSLGDGDLLVFYSDGVTEAMNAREELFGEVRLASAVEKHNEETPEALTEILCRQVREFTGSDTFRDDLTILVIRV